MSEAVAARDVDGAEQPSRVRVVHGGRRTGPRLHLADEVLGREDLHRAVDGDGRARRVRPHRRLRPAGARHEVHPVRRLPRTRVALHPQQPAVRVAHREQMLAVRGERAHQLAEQRHHTGQRMLRPVAAEIALRHLHRRRGVRADVRARRAAPGRGDDGAHGAGHGAGRGEPVVRAAQRPDPLGRIGARLQGDPLFGQRGLQAGSFATVRWRDHRHPGDADRQEAEHGSDDSAHATHGCGDGRARRDQEAATSRMYRSQSQFGPGSVWSAPGTSTWPMMRSRVFGMP